jgi:hypothetical protein
VERAKPKRRGSVEEVLARKIALERQFSLDIDRPLVY